ADNDMDGFGDPNISTIACDQPTGYVDNDGDCNDMDANINPNAQEVCDGIDNDCDGLVDDEDPSISGQSAWYADNDMDGFGDPNTSTLACSQPAGFVGNDADCDDTDANVNPNAQEVCDGIDNDCDGLVDSDDPDVSGTATWFADNDMDGFGDPNISTMSCNQPKS
ncbi:MAG: putative metal-binding motif-containing protein, partial [Myxococcales bacterium]|nr:putative metal-binding motif-containing protein [Myxococcales bacterium]